MLQSSHMSRQHAEMKTEQEQLDKLVHASEKVLFRCTSVFPLDFFPDSIVVTPAKVDIVYSHFFFMKSVHTLLIENILTMRVNVGLIFASVQFEVIGFEQNPPEISFLYKSDAIAVQELVMGLIAAKREGIDLKNVTRNSMKSSANKIGATKENTTGL